MACELGMTVSRLRTELTDAELVHFAAFHELKAEMEEKALAAKERELEEQAEREKAKEVKKAEKARKFAAKVEERRTRLDSEDAIKFGPSVVTQHATPPGSGR